MNEQPSLLQQAFIPKLANIYKTLTNVLNNHSDTKSTHFQTINVDHTTSCRCDTSELLKNYLDQQLVPLQCTQMFYIGLIVLRVEQGEVQSVRVCVCLVCVCVVASSRLMVWVPLSHYACSDVHALLTMFMGWRYLAVHGCYRFSFGPPCSGGIAMTACTVFCLSCSTG